ncbi:MAG: hypothetical protein K9G33_15185 [Sneathiella sp.]|nr:hypothetical protein [Sneathiella sp.]
MADHPEQEPAPNLTVLKWVVGILGFLIVLFAGIIAVTIFMRLTATETKEPPVASVISEPARGGTLTTFGDIRVPIPDDMDVIELSGAGDRLFLTLGTEGAARLILVVSLTDGTILGTLNLEKDGIQ